MILSLRCRPGVPGRIPAKSGDYKAHECSSMKGFLTEDFLLTSDRTRRLSHDFAASRCRADSSPASTMKMPQIPAVAGSSLTKTAGKGAGSNDEIEFAEN
jgi:hypothetical protein